MSQYDFGTIDTEETSGSDLAAMLQFFRDALYSCHVGNTPPSYATKGLFWLDSVSSPGHLLKQYTGAGWAIIGKLDVTAGTFTPYLNNAAIGPFGTAAGKDVGIAIGNVVGVVDVGGGVAGLGALDGRNLINLPSSGGFAGIKRTFIIASGTFTPDPDAVATYVHGVGGGGRGGGTNSMYGSGGGSGYYGEAWISAPIVGGVSVTINGPGGSSIFGGYLTCAAGLNGVTDDYTGRPGGAGGFRGGSGGAYVKDYNSNSIMLRGQPGGGAGGSPGTVSAGVASAGGAGVPGWGVGGAGGTGGELAPGGYGHGFPGTGYGSGGGGAAGGAGGSAAAGGLGTGGAFEVIEFLQ